MTALDDRYGEGATEELREAMTPAGWRTDLEVYEYPDRIDVRLWWRAEPADPAQPPEATAGLEFWEDRKEVTISSWSLGQAQYAGIAADLSLRAPYIARKWGYETLATRGSVDPDAVEIHLRSGYHDPGGEEMGRFVVDISQPDSRIEQYGAWKAGEAPEPEWRRQQRS